MYRVTLYTCILVYIQIVAVGGSISAGSFQWIGTVLLLIVWADSIFPSIFVNTALSGGSC